MSGLGTVLLLGAGVTVAALAASGKKPKKPEELYTEAMASGSRDPAYYNEAIQKLIRAGRADLATGVYNKARAAGVPEGPMQAAIAQATGNVVTSIVQPPSSAAKPSVPEMPLALKQQIEAAMRALGIDPLTGGFVSAPTAAAVEAATAVASQLEASGFPQAAAQLRSWAKLAAAQVAASSPPAIPPTTAEALPATMVDMVNKALQMEGDPKVLRMIAAQLRALPNAQDPKIQLLIGLLEAKAAKAEAAQVVAQTAAQVDQIMTQTPGVVDASQTPFGAPPATVPAVSPIPSMPIPVPSVPVPQPAPAPKSEKQLAAEAMAANLLSVQSAHGMPKAKGREDKSLVSRFQTLAGGKADGMAGPGTLLEAAKSGVCNLPLVMYWPKSATKSRVYQYRNDVRAVAASRPQACAALLESSAVRERGQAGIVGPLA